MVSKALRSRSLCFTGVLHCHAFGFRTAQMCRSATAVECVSTSLDASLKVEITTGVMTTLDCSGFSAILANC
eukprot:2323793-Amphidinium_carterae.1